MSVSLDARFQRIEFSGSTERGNETWEEESPRAESNFSQNMALFEAVLCTGKIHSLNWFIIPTLSDHAPTTMASKRSFISSSN